MAFMTRWTFSAVGRHWSGVIQYHAPFSLMIGAIGAIGVTVMAVIFGDGYIFGY